jgi:hypothetical protein
MVPAIHNYWLAIMAGAFALAMVTWIGLVFWADRHPHGYQQNEPTTQREVMGGAFLAQDGGRQVVPDPREEIIPDNQGLPAETGDRQVPAQRADQDQPVTRDR